MDIGHSFYVGFFKKKIFRMEKIHTLSKAAAIDLVLRPPSLGLPL